MKTALLLFISLALSILTAAQTSVPVQGVYSVKGKIQDEKAVAVGMANITLLRLPDSMLVAAVLSSAEGNFLIEGLSGGEYILRFSSIGFTEKYLQPFQLNAEKPVHDAGTVSLSADARLLKEVSVTALRPTIVQHADRMVVSVEGTAMAAGNTAFDVLSRAPGIFIDAEGNIQLNGRAGVTVMIDGRLTYLSARDLRTMLEGMSAENIKNIEIITNPSAKYDAEGTSGILNINLKKNTQRGINGSVYANYMSNFVQHGYSYGGNINHRSGKWNSFLNLDGIRRVGGREATFTRIFYDANRTTYFDQVAEGNFQVDAPPSIRAGTDYAISSKHSIGFTGYYSFAKSSDDFLTETFMGNQPKQPNLFIDADNFGWGKFHNLTTNLHYLGSLDTAGKTFSIDLDYVRIRNHRNSDFRNLFINLDNMQQEQDFLFTDIPSGYDIFAVRTDYVHPVKNGKLEMGGKFSRVISDNDSRFYFNNNGLVPDPQRTNHFNYRENILAAYLNWNGRLGSRLSVQAGLRTEHTRSTGNSYTTGQVTERDYLDFFPSLFVQQKVSADYGINYSYSRRLTRPNYGNLNPFRFYRDPYTWSEGNPYLRPQYTHAFSISQSYKQRYILTLSFQHNRDVMAEIPILNVADAVTIYTTGNVDDGYNASMTGIVPVKITKWWDSQNTLLLSFAHFSMMSNNGRVINEQLFHMIQSNQTLQLPKSIRMELNLLYRGPAAYGLYHMKSMSRVDVAFKRSFFNKKIDLSLNANDIFKDYRFIWTTDINGNVNEFNQYMRFRNIGFTLRYNFSKGQKVENKRRNNSLEEVNRT